MEPVTPAVESILRAGRRLIAEQGPERFTFSAVAAAAGVSRPTLYRWFPTRADLIGAISLYEERAFDVGLQAVVAAHRGRRARLRAALRYIIHYLDESMLPQSMIDPSSVLGFMAESLDRHVDMLAQLLDDALLEIPAVQRGGISTQQAAEIFLRMAYSHYLVPHRDADGLLGSLLDFAGIAEKPARVAVAPGVRGSTSADGAGS